MESKDRKIESYLKPFAQWKILLPLLLQSCWMFESNIQEKDLLFDNFKVIKDRNNENGGFTLVLNYDEVYYTTIEERCDRIYFDSTNIFVKSTVADYDTTTRYMHIEVHSLTTNNEDAVFEKRELNSVEFNKLVNECKKCVVRNYK